LQESSSSHWHFLSSLAGLAAGGEATHSFRKKYKIKSITEIVKRIVRMVGPILQS
jgi:hypothetical protein